MADKEKITAALAQLDPLDDDQWTADGAPLVDVVTKLVGEPVTRKDIVEAAPDFNREKAGEGGADEDEETETDTETDSDQEQEQQPEEETSNDPETTQEPETQEDTDAEASSAPSEEMTEAEFVAWLNSVPKEELEDVAQALRDQKSQVDKSIEEQKALGLRIKKAINITNLRIRALHPNTTNRDATRQFIESQNKARAERVARRSVVLKHLSAKDIEPRAPIDAAMARKNKRGTQRPARPLMK